jgi:hypothetical protein
MSNRGKTLVKGHTLIALTALTDSFDRLNMFRAHCGCGFVTLPFTKKKYSLQAHKQHKADVLKAQEGRA